DEERLGGDAVGLERVLRQVVEYELVEPLGLGRLERKYFLKVGWVAVAAFLKVATQAEEVVLAGVGIVRLEFKNAGINAAGLAPLRLVFEMLRLLPKVLELGRGGGGDRR